MGRELGVEFRYNRRMSFFWRVLVWVAVALGVIAVHTSALATPQTTAAVGAGVAPETVEEPDSPRASMQHYFELCNKAKYAEAAIYLDTPRSEAKRGPELAQMLAAVLSKKIWIEVDQLSGASDGKKDDGLPANTDEIGRIKMPGSVSQPVRIVRREARTQDEEARWVFSQQTVAHIDEWYSDLDDRWIRKRIPAPLLEMGPEALLWWQWIALPLLMTLALAIGRVLSYVSRKIVSRMALRTPTTVDDRLVLRLDGPIAIAWALLITYVLVPKLGLYVPAEQFVRRLLKAFGLLAFFWALFRAVAVVCETIAEAPWAISRPGVQTLASVGARAGKIAVGAIGVVAILSQLGYPVASLITGLGIGGVVLALAAQKTVENLFGSISILADQPFRVGDFIRVDGVEGRVETIGLRSTRIRTADRTLVILPNGKLADMRIESFASRDRFRLVAKLPILKSASPETIKSITNAIEKILDEHPKTKGLVHSALLVGYTDQSIDIETIAYVATTDAIEFGKIRDELLAAFLVAIRETGAELASPHVVMAPAAPAA